MLEGQQVQLPLVTISNQLRLDELGCDNLETWRTRQLAPIMYKLKIHLAPDHLAQIFNTTSSMYPYNLRNSKHNMFVPRPYTEAEKNTFHYRGAVFWNSLPNTFKGQTSLKSFISHLLFNTILITLLLYLMLFYCMIFAWLSRRAFLWITFCVWIKMIDWLIVPR